MIFNNLIAVSAKKFLFEMFVSSPATFHDYILSPMLFLERFANNDLYIPVSSRFTGSATVW